MMDLGKFFEKKICVAFSGGVDSTSLLHYLKNVEKEYGFLLSAVHCEHGIRGEESVEDMRFAEQVCREWEIPLAVFREDCPRRAKREKVSLETAARNFRLECFRMLVERGKADFIATAHHASDEAETVLFRLARGASLSGASGMTEQSGFMIRPFLSRTKKDILDYVKKNGLTFCEDKTNYEADATRNKLRLTVLPALENAVAGAGGNLARFAFLAAEDDGYLYKQSEKLLSVNKNGETEVAFCDEKPLFRRACLTAIKRLGLEKDYKTVHLESVFMLQESERGAKLNLPQGVIAQKRLKGIAFYKEEQRKNDPPFSEEEKPFGESGFEGGRYSVIVRNEPPETENGEWKTLRIDADKLPENAVFRFRKEGDEIEKYGGGKKSLKKFFNEKKIPVKDRERLPLIAENSGSEVYVVFGVEIAESVKVTENTRRVFYIILQKK